MNANSVPLLLVVMLLTVTHAAAELSLPLHCSTSSNRSAKPPVKMTMTRFSAYGYVRSRERVRPFRAAGRITRNGSGLPGFQSPALVAVPRMRIVSAGSSASYAYRLRFRGRLRGFAAAQSLRCRPSRSDASPICADGCGDGVCAEIVCMGEGCPCAENAATCAADCG